MIPPPFLPRFEGDPGVDIATQAIDAVFPDGERRRVILRLGAPYRHQDEYRIRAELEGLDRTDGPLSGCESLDALRNGIAWLPGRLRIFAERHGCIYYWPDSESIFEYSQFFDTRGL